MVRVKDLLAVVVVGSFHIATRTAIAKVVSGPAVFPFRAISILVNCIIYFSIMSKIQNKILPEDWATIE